MELGETWNWAKLSLPQNPQSNKFEQGRHPHKTFFYITRAVCKHAQSSNFPHVTPLSKQQPWETKDTQRLTYLTTRKLKE